MNRPPTSALTRLLVVLGLVALAGGCGGDDSSDSASADKSGDPIVIGTANSLTGALAPFELAINQGMEVAADEINAAGGVDGRRIEIIHVDAKSDLNLSATATLEVIEKGADIVVPICDADLGAPGARAANEKGVLAITCAGAPGLGRQAIGPLTYNTYAGAPTEGAIGAEYSYKAKGWRTAYLLCDQSVEYTKVLCSAFETRWKQLGGEIAGKDTFLQSDTSIAAQVTRLRSGPQPDVVLLGSYPAGSPALNPPLSSPALQAAPVALPLDDHDGDVVLAAGLVGLVDELRRWRPGDRRHGPRPPRGCGRRGRGRTGRRCRSGGRCPRRTGSGGSRRSPGRPARAGRSPRRGRSRCAAGGSWPRPRRSRRRPRGLPRGSGRG